MCGLKPGFISIISKPVCGLCLGEKENSLKTDDYGRDLSSVQTLLTKQVLHLPKQYSPFPLYRVTLSVDIFFCLQETFDAGLQAFQQEGITNITALKDQLLAAKHVQSKAIEARHAALMKRWNQLLSNSAARKKKLLEAQEHFRKVKRPEEHPVLKGWSLNIFVHTSKDKPKTSEMILSKINA